MPCKFIAIKCVYSCHKKADLVRGNIIIIINIITTTTTTTTIIIIIIIFL